MTVDDANLAVMKADVIAKIEANSVERDKLENMLDEIESIETTTAGRDMMYDKLVTDLAAL